MLPLLLMTPRHWFLLKIKLASLIHVIFIVDVIIILMKRMFKMFNNGGTLSYVFLIKYIKYYL